MVDLGGVHKYDLTPDVTHLIVGEYDTPKYRHVAKERPDIRPMAAGWVEAVRDLWVEDADIDFAALEETWRLRTLETSGGDLSITEQQPVRGRLLCCLTGFDDPEKRQEIIDMIIASGGDYTGDLTRRVTHLLVHKPEGRKYTAARSWSIQTVSIEWLQDSIKRGMILDEKCYDPLLPKEERGKGAWTKREVETVSLGKRLREGASAAHLEGKRKLRKTASMKLNSQRDNLWGDILGKPPTADPSARPAEEPTQPNTPSPLQAQPSGKSLDTQGSRLASLTTSEDSVFAACCFHIYGFTHKKAEILVNAVASLGGLICNSIDDVASNSGAQLIHRFLIVPQDSPAASHPSLPENVQIVTEFFIEKCLHKKQLFNPNDSVIGQPFPVFPIDGFQELAICTTGFTGVDLHQVYKTILQLGASYDEKFKEQNSLLLCSALGSARKVKLDSALLWGVPVVSVEWLWSCISTGFKVPIKDFMFPQLKQKVDLKLGRNVKQNHEEATEILLRKPAVSQRPTSKRGARDTDVSVCSREERGHDPPPRTEATKENSDATTRFDTALTHLSQDQGEEEKVAAPLSEVSSNSRNRSLSPQKPAQPAREPRSRVPSEIANSEATDEPNDMDAELNIVNENEIYPVGEVDAGAMRKSHTEEDKVAKMAADRLALSAKLTTLLGSAACNTTTMADNGISGPGNSNDAARLESSRSAPATAGRPTRRRREIMGRAISNVSATSSGSVESASGGVGAVSNPKALSAAGNFSSVFTVDGGGGATAADGDVAPSSTQLEYEDPDAKKCKAELMRKMRGTVQKTATATAGTAKERMTIGELGGYDAAQSKTAAGTRSRRRRQD